ncbi:hypothetical protein [Streptomyces sp. NPDC051000]|uniref:hypothetical protein n=1 Tax=Streptomyces sp. NPDC051000 TaxID=3155520 RepID=UPI0033F8057C
MPGIELSRDDSLEEIAEQIGRETGTAVTQAAFASAYLQLALVSDEGDPAVTSTEVLRDMALQAEASEGDRQGPLPGHGREWSAVAGGNIDTDPPPDGAFHPVCQIQWKCFKMAAEPDIVPAQQACSPHPRG